MKLIIADTSCLILYDKIDQFDILKRTFTEIVVTKEVAEEFGELPNWVKTVSISESEQFVRLINQLGKGEASAITLALENKNSILLIDEKKGRKIAQQLNINIIGSLGVLLKAKEKGVVRSVEEILKLIDTTDFRISQSIRNKILEK